MMRFRLLLILSLLSASVLRGYPADVNHKTDTAIINSKNSDTVDNASTTFPYIYLNKGNGSWIKRINYSKKSIKKKNYLFIFDQVSFNCTVRSA